MFTRRWHQQAIACLSLGVDADASAPFFSHPEIGGHVQAKSRKRRRPPADYYYDSWWKREYGGMPVWGIVVALIVICLLVIFALTAR